MRLPSRPSATGPGGLLALLLVLLAVLGTLQYRWSGEISQAERVRMRAGAQARADAFARELDREVTRIFLRLPLDQEALGRRDFTRFAERYDAWRARAEQPALVAEVYLVEWTDAEPRVERYVPGRRTFETAAWPERLGPVRERVGLWARPGVAERAPRPGPIAFASDGAPVLTIPVFPGEPSTWRVMRTQPVRIRPSAGLAVVLDASVIRTALLPALAARHFGGADGLEYNLAIAREDDPAALVWSSAGPASARGPGDAESGLLELRPEEASGDDVRDLLGPRMVIAGEGGVAMGGAAPAPGRPSLNWTITRRVDAGGERVSLRPSRPGLWRLSATHRAGSLDAVVASARRRNLAVSFGILLLLGASGGFLVTSARRAQRLARQQIEFVAGVTHELRTPLAVIRSAGENLADGLIERHADVRNYGALVRDEGRRLTDMVEQALLLAGAESGRQTEARRPVDVGRLVQCALADWRAGVAEGRVRTEEHLATGLPRVLGDEGALTRVVRNLLDNALKYGGETPWVGVRTRADDGGRAVALVVEDRGLGVPADERARIFEPFFRGRDATDRQIRGSGLGLSLVRRIVESHGGRIAVDARADGGSAFTVTFPGWQGPIPEVKA
ncbi:MAG: HAMP domain-containing sensor histidine kinase [Vicinamibacteria bacterium]